MYDQIVIPANKDKASALNDDRQRLNIIYNDF